MPPPKNAAGPRSAPLSKFSPPTLHRVFHRPRLLEIFKQNQDKKLILLIGQAAQGKSTAATAYYQTSTVPSSWINLGPEESDPVGLYSLLVQALLGGPDQPRAARLLALSSRATGPRETRSSFREWTETLWEAVDPPRQLFMDGLDRLRPQSESFLLLQVLIEGLPEALRLILLSRAYPPLQLDFQQMIMARRALVLTNEDLAFSPQEIKFFYKDLLGLSLTPEQVERIHHFTEGWVGGMVLLQEALQKFFPDSAEKLLAGKWTERFHKDAFQYFGREVLTALSKAEQDFLLRAAVLDHLEPALVRDLFPGKDGEILLKEMARRNLFVQAFPDPNRGFIFRFHRLFKDFLTTLYHSRFSQKEQNRWQRGIGSYYAGRGNAAEAISHFLAARDYPAAAELIRQEGINRIKTGQLNELASWLEELPQPLVREDPRLTLFQVLPQRFSLREETFQNLIRELPRFKKAGDLSGLLMSLGYLIEAKYFQGRYDPELIREAQEVLKGCPGDELAYERAFLWCQVGVTLALRGNPRRGYWACRNAYLLSRQLSDPVLQIMALCYGIYALTILGELREAGRLLREAGSLSWGSANAELHCHYLFSRIAYLTFKGEAQSARELTDRLVAETERQGLSYLYPAALFHQQFTLHYLLEDSQVQQLGAQIRALAGAVQVDFLIGLADFYSGISAYWSNRLEEARERIQSALRCFGTGDSYSELHRAGSRLVKALLENRPGKRSSAIKDLQEESRYLEQIQSYLLLSECRLALGILCHDQGQAEQARAYLEEGLHLARQKGYRHFMLISPRDTVRACLLAQEYWDPGNPEAEFGLELLSRKYGGLAEAELRQWADHPESRIRETVLSLQRSLHRASRPVLHIETFGGLRLAFGHRKMEENAWDRIQPRRLLAAILSRKEEQIHKEVLIESLWPDERPGTGENNFKTTLQRLRRTLESEIDPRFSSSYIHLHQNLVFLDEELCRVDCREFEALARQGRVREEAGDRKDALERYQRAAALYGGEFIPEEVYGPWAEKRRDDFRNIYIDLLLRSARLLEAGDSFKKAVVCLKKALESDPLLEEAYRRLMALYAGKNQFNEALLTYEACRRSLKAGLGTRPDPITRALYEGIRERANRP